MKRLIGILAALILMLLSCGNNEQLPLEAIPLDYTLSDAKADGCVVHEDGDVTSGKEIFEAFAEKAEKGIPASVRLGFYYTLGDPSHYSPEYYEEVKDNYPVLYIQDLSFDGEKYTLRSFEDGKEIIKSYKYMKCLPFYPKNLEADYESVKHYVLLDDNTVTSYDTLWKSIASSMLGAYIPHSTVYSEFIR